jgi:hypothetical protein
MNYHHLGQATPKYTIQQCRILVLALQLGTGRQIGYMSKMVLKWSIGLCSSALKAVVFQGHRDFVLSWTQWESALPYIIVVILLLLLILYWCYCCYIVAIVLY